MCLAKSAKGFLFSSLINVYILTTILRGGVTAVYILYCNAILKLNLSSITAYITCPERYPPTYTEKLDSRMQIVVVLNLSNGQNDNENGQKNITKLFVWLYV